MASQLGIDWTPSGRELMRSARRRDGLEGNVERANNQIGLFWEQQPTAPYVSGSKTSEFAAQKITPVTGEMRTRVFDCIRLSPDGRTDDEIEVLLGMRHQTASARRRELVQQGHVVDSGNTRRTRSGCPATVWVYRLEG